MEKLFEDAKRYANIWDFMKADYNQLLKYNEYIKESKKKTTD